MVRVFISLKLVNTWDFFFRQLLYQHTIRLVLYIEMMMFDLLG